ncbi:MAG: hypothetical protein QOF76_1646 [Solirubrobacteraceae bacterium]|jgi:hypothetical protein|nr:hypothetical protein [Solirubrobacteraceae bacterium]
MSNPPEERLREMKAAFREAARQEIAQTPAPAARWRWSGRTAAGVIVGIAATGGLATATGLIDLGSPTRSPDKPDRYRARTGVSPISVTTPDPGGSLAWGVVTFTSRSGEACAQPGRVRGEQLGRLKHGTFHPLGQHPVGACADLHRLPFVGDVRRSERREVIFGRARPGVARIEVQVGTRTVTAATGTDGAFIVVLARGSPLPTRLRALDVAGKEVK